MTEKQVRESRSNPAYPSFPGKVEYGCLHQSLKNGPLDRVFIEPEDDAIYDVLRMRENGIKAVLVKRAVPAWEEIPMSVAELRDYVTTLEILEQEAKELAAEKARLEEERRRAEDGDLGWKEL